MKVALVIRESDHPEFEMPDCPKCNASVPIEAQLCPDCGAQVAPEALTSADPADPGGMTHNTLLKAHLYKIRGDSEGAIQECIKALRMDPDNLEAHSLLGDIYKSQGRIEEATHWYKLALDLSPENQTNRARLDQLRLDKREISSLPEVGEPKKGYSVKNRRSDVLIFSILAVVALLLITIIVVVRTRSIQPNQEQIHSNLESQRYQVTPPAESHLTPSSSTGPSIEERTSKTSVATDSTTATIKALNELPALLDNNLHVTNVTFDPRNNSATVAFISPSAEEGITGQNLVRNSFTVAREAFLNDDSLALITIRVLARIQTEEGSKVELVFIGELERGKVLKIDPEASVYQDQMEALSNTWWHEGVRESSEVKTNIEHSTSTLER